jgi:hypothetical protein
MSPIRALLVLAAVCCIGVVVAIPEDLYELQRRCWKDGCPARLVPRTIIANGGQPLTYDVTDASVAYPINLCKSTPREQRLYTDECRINGILGRDDVDVYLLDYNHTTKARATTRPINTVLLLLASDRTDNINVVLAAFVENLPAAADSSNKQVSESQVRAVATGIPASFRLAGSVVLSTRNKTPNYVVVEQGGLSYWTFDNYTSGCALTPPVGPPYFGYPFNLDQCDLSNGLRLNAAGATLPSAGRVFFVLYETHGRPVPYVFGTGADSPINYALVANGVVPGFLFPQFVLSPAERDILQGNLRMLSYVGDLTVDAGDVVTSFEPL